MVGAIEDEEAMQGIDNVIEAVDGVKRPIRNYSYLKKELLANGLTPRLADWLSTSVRRNATHQYEFVFKTSTIRAMLKTYRQADYWDVFGNPPESCSIRLVRAERNPLWTEEIVERLEILTNDYPQLSTRLVRNSGHWVQVDNPEGLYEAIKDMLI